MAGYFGMSVSDFIEQYYEMSLEDYAKENLKKQCVQDLLLKENSIEITDADVDEEIQYYIDELGYKDKKKSFPPFLKMKFILNYSTLS